ncbi:Variant-specific surface protein [Giardia duodenalis]|uniref:Variant-specific surface protein n=1 Tax=Giardia intestinalis TaxID=5741 RepID=V6TS00_GIAIN|nr:Variant-specific surface protein [Giardia intestinalis]
MLYLAGLAFACLALADPKSCTNSQNCASSGTNCLDVNINGQQKEVCTKCEATHVPIDGACQAKDGQDKCTPQDTPDGTCKACKGSTYLYKGGCYAACPQGTYADSTTNQCKACGNSCVTCEASAAGPRCTKCEATHVPIDGACQAKDGQDKCTPQDTPDGTCKACKGSTYLYKGGCYAACPQGTPNSETHTCDGVPAPDCDLPNCEVCSEDKQKCTKCQSNYFLTPERNACLASCPAGSYAVGQTCAPCDPSCAECSGAGASKCTACPAGKMLRYADETKLNEGGQCVEQCVEGPECETCGLTIGGTKYCSKCKGSNVPLNGVCTSNAARTRFCTNAVNGACTVCAAGYFIQEGGCYKTDRLPGKSICTTPTGDGKCQTCANGLTAVSNMCPLCDSTCATCTVANQPDKCSACPPGRYLDASKACKLCTETSSSIQGVANCASCAPPTGNSGSVICYLIQNTNKSGLSTGAIAGISVAVVVVVGGLVGFLCWWFLCRGKA